MTFPAAPTIYTFRNKTHKPFEIFISNLLQSVYSSAQLSTVHKVSNYTPLLSLNVYANVPPFHDTMQLTPFCEYYFEALIRPCICNRFSIRVITIVNVGRYLHWPKCLNWFLQWPLFFYSASLLTVNFAKNISASVFVWFFLLYQGTVRGRSSCLSISPFQGIHFYR